MIKNIKAILTLSTVIAVSPLFALAQFVMPDPGPGGTVVATSGGMTLGGLINIIIGYLDQILVLLMALAVVMFVWYVIKYFVKADSDKKEAGSYVMYSLIGFFVILSLWGIINILSNTFHIGNANNTSSSLSNLHNLLPQ